MTSIIKKKEEDFLGLEKDEKIIENYNCFLVETLPIYGQLYLTENHLCFYSNLLFFNRNISISLNEIINLELNSPIIEIESKNLENISQKYKFLSNENIQIIHDKIKSSISLMKLDLKKNNSSSTISKRTSASSDLSNEEFEEINFTEKTEDDVEICKKIIRISPKDLFNKYFTNSSPETSFEKYYDWVGDHNDVIISEWQKIENNENFEFEKYKRTENFTLTLHNVPMVEHSQISKTSIYYIDKNGIYYINNSTKNEGIPFSDSFTIEAKIELYPYFNGTKTIFRTYIRTNFLKSNFLKGLLISQANKSYKEEINKWLEFIGEKGEIIEGDYINKKIIINDNNKENKDKNHMKSIENQDIKNIYKTIYKKLNKKSIGIMILFLAILFNYLTYFKK